MEYSIISKTVHGDSNQPQWYAIHTKAKQEGIAGLNYQRQGYHVYLPRLRKIVRHARRTTEKLAPFFPGYLFLHLTPEERNWTSIASTRGSLGALCFGNTHIPIPNWVIDDLKAREDQTHAIPMAETMREKLVPGCAVNVSMSEDERIQGVIYSSRGTDNVDVLLSILGRQVKSKVSIARIEIG
jgi:transcriptional antiterminator RfaH